jgi:hypothetical protein
MGWTLLVIPSESYGCQKVDDIGMLTRGLVLILYIPCAGFLVNCIPARDIPVLALLPFHIWAVIVHRNLSEIN